MSFSWGEEIYIGIVILLLLLLVYNDYGWKGWNGCMWNVRVVFREGEYVMEIELGFGRVVIGLWGGFVGLLFSFVMIYFWSGIWLFCICGSLLSFGYICFVGYFFGFLLKDNLMRELERINYYNFSYKILYLIEIF